MPWYLRHLYFSSKHLVWVPLLHPDLENLQTESARPLCRQPKCFFPVHPGSASFGVLLIVFACIHLASDLCLVAHLNNKAVAHHVREDPCSLLKRRSLGFRWLTTLLSRPISTKLATWCNPRTGWCKDILGRFSMPSCKMAQICQVFS